MNRWLRFALFAAVGLSGILVNSAVMWAAHAVGLDYVAAAVIATQTAIGWNLLLSEWFVFNDRRTGTLLHRRVVRYYLVNNIDLLLRVPLLILLVENVGMRPSPANLVLVVVASVLKYAAVARLVYRPAQVPPHPVDVHLPAGR